MDWFGDTFFIISTHAPLAGRDRSPTLATGSSRIFQPTRPLRGATTRHIQRFARTLYFNPRAPCGARRSLGWVISSTSIFHPTRPLRGATADDDAHGLIFEISTHAPLAGRDEHRVCMEVCEYLFQPTRPLRGATYFLAQAGLSKRFQPTRPLRGATIHIVVTFSHGNISTHAPLAGRDPVRML